MKGKSAVFAIVLSAVLALAGSAGAWHGRSGTSVAIRVGQPVIHGFFGFHEIQPVFVGVPAQQVIIVREAVAVPVFVPVHRHVRVPCRTTFVPGSGLHFGAVVKFRR